MVCVIVSCMAKKPADLDHPYGHGRVELAGSVVVAAMLLLAAWLIGVESIDKLKNPNQGELKWACRKSPRKCPKRRACSFWE